MVDYKLLMSLLFLFGVLVFTIYNLILFKRHRIQGNGVFRVLFYFNVLILVHAGYGFVSNLFFDDRFFLYLGDPLALFYAPFFIILLKAEIHYPSRVSTKFWFWNFLPGVLFSVAYLSLLLFSSLYDSYVMQYTKILFAVVGVQMIGSGLCGIWLIHKFRVVGRKTKVWNLFLDGLIVLCIAGAFFFTGIHKVNELIMGQIPSNEYIVNFFMLLGAIILHRVFDIRFYIKPQESQLSLPDKKYQELVLPSKQENATVAEEKYGKSRVNLELLESYASKIGSLKVEYFLKGDLNIDQMSTDLKISTHHLSQVFSIVFQSNYNQYINRQRVLFSLGLLQEQLQANEDDKKSISEIAFLSGFNSDSSFYRAFKDNFGLSPVQWMRNQTKI